MTTSLTLTSPLGPLRLTATQNHLTRLDHAAGPLDSPDSATIEHPVLAAAAEQLTEYFAGRRNDFNLPLDPAGTEFQRRVWRQLRLIPFGQTATYGQIAAALNQPTAARAVGLANARNPLSIVVPCHRVVGADGTLTGYAGGLRRKQRLLDHEAAPAPLFASPLFPLKPGSAGRSDKDPDPPPEADAERVLEPSVWYHYPPPCPPPSPSKTPPTPMP
jgi:methylated-DNA-[protein]-cysteine S-methyltransferase